MPKSPMRPCPVAGCPALVRAGRCQVHQARDHDRPNADVRAWYHTAQWRRIRQCVLWAHPLCVQCQTDGRISEATDVDHIDPHQGNLAKFYDYANLQGLCASCHARKTREGQ